MKGALCLLSILALTAGQAAPLPLEASREIPGRRVPELITMAGMVATDLDLRAVPLPEANLASARVSTNLLLNPEVALVKFRGKALVSALRVEAGREAEAVELLRRRTDVEFAELDTFERRQFTPNDAQFGSQWQHQVIGSARAWDYGLGQGTARVAIVDAPFQMDHPDLAANTVSGWDVVANQPITASAGIAHSTLCAGMAAAVINNGVGVAGAANCRVLPININGAISEMYNATLWAASNGVRVVNISWSGATNAVLEAAGQFLKTNAGGILVMSAVDGNGTLNGPNQPDVFCVSMTDAADNFQLTLRGAYIDFAAPGYQVYSTTTGGGYATATGCSFAAPLVAGVMAWMLGTNPTLQPDEVIGILTNTAVDLGPAGWDQFYGWGRLDFGAAAAATVATLPNILSAQWTHNTVAVTAHYRAGLTYSLWRAGAWGEGNWAQVATVQESTNGGAIILTDLAPPAGEAFYRVQAAR